MATKHSTQGSVVIHRIRTGKDGRDAGSYYLTVSPTEFSLDADGNVKGDGKVQVQAWLSVAAGSPVKAADSDIYLVVKAYKTDGTEATILAKQQAAYEFNVKTYSSYKTFVIILYDGTAKTNQWDSVTVIVGAQDAKDAVRVDLENENDSMLYQGDGTTKVNGDDQFLTSQAHLYDGIKKDPDGVVWSIDSKTDGCDATISAAGLVRVNSITALVNEIKVKAVYKGGSYYATMTVKKLVGVDKYELWLSEVAVGYNTTTKSATATSVTIRVYKTAQNGTRTNISTLPNGMTVSGSSSLSRAYSGGYATMPVDTSKSENYVVLKQGTQELDRETIPILSFVNGQNVIRLDLDNENDSILYQGDGSTMVGSKPQSKWYLYDGITDVSADVDTADVSIESTSTGVSASFVDTTKRSIKIDGIEATSGGSGDVIVKVKYKGDYYRARMTVKRLVGVDKYELEVSPNAVGFNTSTNTNTGDTITVRVWKTAQNDTRTNISTLPSGYKLLVNGTDYASSYSSKKYSFTASSNVSNYVIVLSNGSSQLDTETVPVLSVANGSNGSDGKDGKDGKDGGQGPGGISYILDVRGASISFGSTGLVSDDDIYGYAYKLQDGSYSAVDLTASGNYVKIRYNGTRETKITYDVRSNGYFDDDDDLYGIKLTSQMVYIELYVNDSKVASQPILVMLPGLDGYNYLPINNGVYDPDKTYTWNIEKRDFVDIEEDGEWNRYGVRSFGMTVPANTPPPNSSYWTKIQQKLQTVFANCIFGTNANIGGFLVSAQMLKSQSGALVLDGIRGLIQMFHSDGYSWQVLNDGRQVMGIYTDDNNFGEHLEMDPAQKEFRVYDSDGALVTTVSGKKYSTLDEIFGNNSGDVTLTSGTTSTTKEVTATSTSNASQDSSSRVTNSFYTSSPTRVTVKGSLIANANSFVQKTGSSGNYGQQDKYEVVPAVSIVDEDGYFRIYNSAYVAIRIETRATNSTSGTLLHSTTIGSVSSNEGNSVSKNLNASADVPAGYHFVYVVWSLYAYRSTYNSYAKVTYKLSGVSYTSDVYLSRMFANGIAFGTSQNNFFALMNIYQNYVTRMMMKMITEDSSKNQYGMLLDNGKGFQVNRKGYLGCVFPTILYCYVSWTAKDTYSVITHFSFNGSSPTLERRDLGDDGVMRVKMPSGFPSLGLSSCIVNVTAVNTTNRNAHIYGLGSNYVDIECNDDTSNNYSSFILEIKYKG